LFLCSFFHRSCSTTLKSEIEDLINMLGSKFCSQYCQVDHNSALHNDFAEKRLIMAKIWFYKLFENIIAKEAKNPKYDIKVYNIYYIKFMNLMLIIYYTHSHLYFSRI